MSLNQATFFSPILAFVKDLFLSLYVCVCSFTNHIVWALEKRDVIQCTYELNICFIQQGLLFKLHRVRSKIGPDD